MSTKFAYGGGLSVGVKLSITWQEKKNCQLPGKGGCPIT